MAKAILARPDVEEFSDEDIARGFTLSLAPLTRLAKDLLLRNGPRHGCDDERQDEYPEELGKYRHVRQFPI